MNSSIVWRKQIAYSKTSFVDQSYSCCLHIYDYFIYNYLSIVKFGLGIIKFQRVWKTFVNERKLKLTLYLKDE